MKIVIDIPENQYATLNAKTQADIMDVIDHGALIKAIKNGTPLPVGHGDLIDRKELLEHYDNTEYFNGVEMRKIHFVQIGYINDAPTIIEADKEGETKRVSGETQGGIERR